MQDGALESISEAVLAIAAEREVEPVLREVGDEQEQAAATLGATGWQTFWRVTLPRTGRSVIALIGVNQGPRGPWATLGLAGHPDGALAVAAPPGAVADPGRLGAAAGGAFVADAHTVRVDLGPDHRLELEVADPVLWPPGRLGGSSVFLTLTDPGAARPADLQEQR